MPFKPQGLQALQRTLDEQVAAGAAPGMVGLVAQGAEAHAFSAGRMALDGPPMRRDAIFRIASMTKPITAAVAMMLVEHGLIAVDAPVERWLPELADMRVLRTPGSPLHDTVPPRRSITVEDLLTFRLGWGLLFERDAPILQAVADLPGFGMPNPTQPLTPDEVMARLGELPLMSQPGERWLYTTGSNVLGVLIARAAGQPLDRLFEDRILGPLGMADTAFFAPPEKLDRMVTGYVMTEAGPACFDGPDGMFAKPPAFPAGDSGLVSTADDFLEFARFLESGCAADGRRLLSDASLAAMKTDHLTPEQRKDGSPILDGKGWGYGMGVVVEPNRYGQSPGAYSWSGGFGTSWFTDPAKGLIGILLTQRIFDSPDVPPAHEAFWRGAYAALA